MNPINILLVEDNEGDILLTTDALKEGKIANRIDVARDGWEAIQFLKKVEGYENAMIPDLVLLDINLPKMNGHEVLKEIKTSEELKHLPVIMLSTSSSDEDVLDCYRNFASCYITKPVEVNDFMRVISSIEDFWVSIVKLPKTQ